MDISISWSIQIGSTSIPYVATGEWRIHLISFLDSTLRFALCFAFVRQFFQLSIDVGNFDHMIVLYQDIYVRLLGFQSWTTVCSTVLIHMESPEFSGVCGVFSKLFCFATPGQIPTHP